MKTYKVRIIETLEMEVEVEASNRFEAERLVEQQWKDSEHILDADCFSGVKFRAEQPQKNRGYDR